MFTQIIGLEALLQSTANSVRVKLYCQVSGNLVIINSLEGNIKLAIILFSALVQSVEE